MRVQASSFRLPVLKLQPKESQFSLSYGDNNQSSCSMIKYQSSPLRNYDPSPIKKRVRGMTIAIYNSQEKLKTAEFRYGGDFITQTQQVNQSTSVVNTVRRYRSKLKQLMQTKEDGALSGLSRDPRIYSFKEPAATIRLDHLSNGKNDQHLQEKVRQLMGKVKLLFSTQQFYQEPQKQETFQVTMVRLKDEYDCLYQDFNDYYVQNKKFDSQVLQLLNHMEIINKLLKPKRPMMVRKESMIFDDQPQEQIKEPEQVVIEMTPPPPQLPQPEIMPPLESIASISQAEPREESVFTPLTSIQLNEEIPPSDLDLEDSPKSPKKRRQKGKRSPNKSQKSIVVQQSQQDLSVLDMNQVSSQKQITMTSRSRTVVDDIPLKSIRSTQSEQQPLSEKQDQTPVSEKPPLKRTSSNLGSCNKRRNTVLEDKQNKKHKKGATTISELEDSQLDDEEEENEEIQNEDEDKQNITEISDSNPRVYENALLDLLIQSDNIYRYPYFQTWEYHMDRILMGAEFGEYDL